MIRDPKSQKGPYRDPVPKVRALFGTVEKECLGGGRLPSRVYQNVKKLSESLCQALLGKNLVVGSTKHFIGLGDWVPIGTFF